VIPAALRVVVRLRWLASPLEELTWTVIVIVNIASVKGFDVTDAAKRKAGG
jgi:hypothetical protein